MRREALGGGTFNQDVRVRRAPRKAPAAVGTCQVGAGEERGERRMRARGL